MKIACLQFAPQVGDIDNNLNRADAVLAKANPDDLENLDLLVLPELAFTGYNFKSLNEISPFLEPQGSGISALWARTTALKYNSNVVVGYPERVDVSPIWPTGPEYYSSTIVVNGDGETIANYRKSFLYVIDETWALEGKEGFFHDDIPELGSTAMGICMDLNPYRFEAPWHAFEFAFHVLAVEANLVIVTMAWVTREDGRHFSRMPAEPDMETLTYWVQRLEPVIRTENQDEVIVVFCNRTGTEGDLVYAGTSSVIGIKDGEVNVYGVLGRSVKDLLVVDTDHGPFAKLVQRSEQDNDDIPSQTSSLPRKTRTETTGGRATPTNTADQPAKATTRQRRPSPTPGFQHKPRKTKPQSPKIQIPETTFYRNGQHMVIDDSPGIPTPTCPSPTPLNQRPDVTSPRLETKPKNPHVDTPYPGEDLVLDQPHIYGGRVSIDQGNSSTASPGSGRLSEKYFWMGPQPPMKSPMASRFPDVYPLASPTISTPVPSALIDIHLKGAYGARPLSSARSHTPVEDMRRPNRFGSPASQRAETPTSKLSDGQSQEVVPPRPSSPKSRNASRTGRQNERRPSEMNQTEFSAISQKLESLARRPGSAMDSMHNTTDEMRHGRKESRDSRSASRVGHSTIERAGSISIVENAPLANSTGPSEVIVRPQSDIFKNREHDYSRNASQADTSQLHHRPRDLSRTKSPFGSASDHSRSRSGSLAIRTGDNKPHIEPDETRTLLWSELSKMVGEVLEKPHSREVSRGRQPPQHPGRSSSFEVPLTGLGNRTGNHGPQSIPPSEARFASRDRQGSLDQRSMRTILAPDGVASSSPPNPDDEIIAEIIFHSHGRPSQTQVNGSTPNSCSNAASSPAVQRGVSRQDAEMRAGSQIHVPNSQSQASARTKSSRERASSTQSSSQEIKVYKAPTPLNIKNRLKSSDSVPGMDSVSIHTISTSKTSPATPSPRIFEPKTPKAMKLDPDFGTVLSSTSDPTTSGDFPPLDSLGNDLVGMEIPRAKSAIW